MQLGLGLGRPPCLERRPAFGGAGAIGRRHHRGMPGRVALVVAARGREGGALALEDPPIPR
jgi:hypothetical protein